jgi:putative ABC transport system permease protein
MTLSEDDAAAIRREVPDVLVAVPGVRGSAQVTYGSINWSTIIFGSPWQRRAGRADDS